MPEQQQMSSFFKKLGAQVAAANAEHADKPIDTGNRRLPAGIREGIARINSLYTKEYADDKQGLKGQTFFRASAVVLSPNEHNGEKVAGLVTSVIIPLCATPEKGQKKATTFSQNWFEFQNLFKMIGVFPPDGKDGRPDYTDRAIPDRMVASQMIEAYYFAAMKALTDPVRMKTNPIYITFSTRGWTPPATQLQPKPTEMVFEEWHGLAQWNGQVDPAGGVDASPPPAQPALTSQPPSPNHQPTPTPASAPTTSTQSDPADVVASLVEIAMNDPEGATEEGMEASEKLTAMAWAMGWTKEQTTAAENWAAVGAMVLTPPQAGRLATSTSPNAPAASATSTTPAVPTVGSRWLFAKRTKEGSKLKNSKGEEFPPVEVEVSTVNQAVGTCTVKTVKDGKDVVDIRSKKPIDVKFEWLEKLPF